MSYDPDAHKASAARLRAALASPRKPQTAWRQAPDRRTPLPTYNVSIAVTGSLTVTVEAANEAEAQERAVASVSTTLCVSCAGCWTADYDPASEDPPYSLDLDEALEDNVSDVQQVKP